MKRIAVFLFAGALYAQNALMNRADTVRTYRQIVNLLDSTAVAVPELGRAGRPVIENARQDAQALQAGATYNHSAVLYRFLSYIRVYLDLSDALPKPFPFAEESRKQLIDLRQDHDRLEAHFRALLESKERQLRNPDRDNLARYANQNAEVGPPKPGESRVVFLGDSITDGWRLNEYFSGKPYVNRGISGQITGEMLGRMKADVIDLKPAVVLILAGTNDIARGVPVATIRNNLSLIADLAVANQIKPIFASILPIHDYNKDKNPGFEHSPARPPATILELNRWLQNMCRQRGFIYVDYFSATVDDKGFLKTELADDGLHPNAAGYRVMGPLAQSAIDQAVAPPAKGRKSRKSQAPTQ